MTITSYVYGAQGYVPGGRPLASVPTASLSRDRSGRTNYPMLLSRAIDDAGGDAFVIEYAAAPPVPDFGQCCDDPEWDRCFVQGDGACQCPGRGYDAADCAEREDLLAGVALVEDLAARYPAMTRLTTRMSPEEMSFDPMFDPGNFPSFGRLFMTNTIDSLRACEEDVIDRVRYAEIVELQECSTVYCGPGECVATVFGAGCECDDGFVARLFTDLDGEPSVTCVPSTPTVDLGAGGLVLPDGCAGVACGEGTCVELNGVPHCDCLDGAAAGLGGTDRAPVCRSITRRSGTPGAEDYTADLPDIRVCAPAPPSCGDTGWLQQQPVAIRGEACAGREVDPRDLIPKAAPTCPGSGLLPGCACRLGGRGAGAGGWPLVVVFALLGLKLRRPRE